MRVRGARQPDDGSPAAFCGTTADFDECITVLINVPRPQRLLLVGSGEWLRTGGGTGTNRGECRFSVGNNLAQLGLRAFADSSDSLSNAANLAMNSVTGVLDEGPYEISIECRETGGSLVVKNTELSVVALGDG